MTLEEKRKKAWEDFGKSKQGITWTVPDLVDYMYDRGRAEGIKEIEAKGQQIQELESALELFRATRTAYQEQIQSIESKLSLALKTLDRVLSQPFHGSWDAQAVYIQHMLHEIKHFDLRAIDHNNGDVKE